MPRISRSAKTLSERESLQHGNGLMFTQNEPARPLHLSDHVDHFGLRNGDDVVRKDLNVVRWIFCFHDFFQVDFGDAELPRRIKLRFWQRNAAPLQVSSDTHAVPRVGADPASKCQHLEQRFMSLHLVNTGCVYCTQNRSPLTSALVTLDCSMPSAALYDQDFV